MRYNENSPKLDPETITPASGKCIIERSPRVERHGEIYVPVEGKKITFTGRVFSVGEYIDPEHTAIKKGDHVWFSPATAEDDSIFFEWLDKEYALIPMEAVQMRSEVPV